MSQNSSEESPETTEVLEVIREEQCSPAFSSMHSITMDTKSKMKQTKSCIECGCCVAPKPNIIEPEEIAQIISEKEEELRKEFHERLEGEINDLKEKFDFILSNEQVRASYMLREAHRERQEKIKALEAQLECKNLAGLMFVMCAERRKSKLEKLRMIEEYTGYIRALQSILSEGQELILHLSRGYKTAARVDYEWKQKLMKIIKEFQAYILHFSGGTPESNQYLFDLPALLNTKEKIYDDPNEDPCECESDEQVLMENIPEDKPWYESLEGDCRPFVMFGDMADFQPPQRRTVLGAVKAAKTAPKHWKEYVFNEMFLRADCSNLDVIKDEYVNLLPPVSKWECIGVQTDRQGSKTGIHYVGSMFGSFRVADPGQRDDGSFSTCAWFLIWQSLVIRSDVLLQYAVDACVVMRRLHIDLRGNMGSILKIITSSAGQPSAKATLLGARDSMEIASTTKLREKHRQSEASKVVLNIGNRKQSLYGQWDETEEEVEEHQFHEIDKEHKSNDANDEDDDEDIESMSLRIHDSLEVIGSRMPEKDKINYEKECPMEACQHLQMDSFIRSLPSYMRDSPFMHFENTFDNYEPCSPEQLEILKQRIEEKKKREKTEHSVLEEDPVSEWKPEVDGVGVQTSLESLPPCTCGGPTPNPTPVSSIGKIFDMEKLFPMKKIMNEIRKECFYDTDIEFNRFRIIGQQSKDEFRVSNGNEDFTRRRVREITKILNHHPSLCELFQ